MRIDAVFSGGGIKAFAYLGVLKSLDTHHYKLERVAGTSAGSIISAFVAAGFDYKEIESIVNEIQLQEFMDPPKAVKYVPFTKWFYLYFQMGLYKGDKLEKWITQKLAQKNVYTFQDLKKGYLKIIVSDLTLGRLVVLPDDLERYYGISPNAFPIAKAVRMSAGFPFFFIPKKMIALPSGKNLMVDGGLLSNFPLWVFGNKKKHVRPVLGVKLTEKTNEVDEDMKVNNAFQMVHAMFSTMKKAHDMRYISRTDEKDILFVPVEDIGAVDFQISKHQKENLFISGKKRADQFLKRWPR